MADNVQWIKFKVGMFDGESFKRIKRAKIGGVTYRDKLTSVWFELMDLAGKSNKNGYLIDANDLPYRTYEDIAIMLDRDEKEVELCMQFYLSENMVEIIDNIYCLTNFLKYQSEEGLAKIREQARIRQANWKERKKIKDSVTEALPERYSSYSNSISSNNYNTNIIGGIVKGGEELKPLEKTLKEVLTACRTHCPKLYERHLARPNSDYSLGQLLMDFTPPLEKLDDFFKHINKTYIVQPKYQTLDLLWVMNNYDKVLATTEEDEQLKLDKPKNTFLDFPQRDYTEEQLRGIFSDIKDAEV